MEKVRKELASMQKREKKNRSELKELESKLASSTKKAADESNKLITAANNISKWEKRAKKAEGELQQTKRAMETTLRVANEAKALGNRYQEKLTLGVTQLAERESTLNETLTSLKLSQEAASKCQAKVTALQVELDKQSKRYEAAVTALKKAETERDSHRKSKLAAEKSLTRLKGQLASLQTTADKLPGLEKELAAARKTISEKQQAETEQARVAARLAKSSDQVKGRLDEILMEREELHDNLTILRNEFAQYRITAKSEQDRFAKESVNQLQASLARESSKYTSELEKRDARLAQLEKAFREKEQALQATYKREKETSSKLSKATQSRDAEAKARKSLSQALEQLRTDLESSQKKACKLQEQLVELKSLSLED
jgi:chromosome segregation ATPase